MTLQESISNFLSALLTRDSMVYRSERLDEVKSNICDGALISIAILSIPALIASLPRAYEVGVKPIMFVHVFFAITFLVICLARKRLSYSFRSIILISTSYIIAVAGMLQFGLLSATSIWFVVSPVLASILFNARSGIGMMLVSIISFTIIAILDVKGSFPFAFNTNPSVTPLLAWINYSIAYLLSAVVLLVAVSISTKNLIEALTSKDSITKELMQFIEKANTPIFGIDSKGFINEWNQSAEEITGYKKDEVLGAHWVEYIPIDSKGEAMKILKDALEGKQTANYEFLILTKNGQEVILLVNTSTRRNTLGEITGVLAVGQNITELVGYRNELELKVDERTIKLNEALEKQKELNELKSKFVSIASHEFRTPLSAINFAAGSMKKYWSKMEPIMVANKLTKIEDQVELMTLLLDDILIVGQAEAGKIKNKPLRLNLGNFIDEIIEEVYHSSKKAQKIVLIDTKKLKNMDVFIDEKLGRNIFINLISNAVKFSPDAHQVNVELSSEKDHIIISVTDFGIGIPKSEEEKIFMPFTRGENVDLIPGTGLGLSIVKEAVDLMRGEIFVNSTVGKGTTFVVKIPQKINTILTKEEALN